MKGTFFLGVAHGTLQNKPVKYWIKINNKKTDVTLVCKQLSRNIDLALFFLPNRELVPCFEIADENPTIGQSSEMVGFPWNSKGIRIVPGHIIDAPLDRYSYGFSVKAESGDSGGPIISVPERKVIGIVISYAIEDSTGLFKTNVNSVKDIREFLTTYITGVPKCQVTLSPKKPKEKLKDPNENLKRKIKFLELKVRLGESEFKKQNSKIENLVQQILDLKNSLLMITDTVSKIEIKTGPVGPQGPEGKAGKVNINIKDLRTGKLTEHKDVKLGSTLEVTIHKKDQ